MSLKILKFTFLILIPIFLSGCLSLSGMGRTADEMDKLLADNRLEFNDFVEYFLSQNEIKNIQLNTRNDDDCKSINQWGICPREEEKWGKLTGEVIKGVFQEEYLDSLEDVLNKEQISRNAYDKVVLFMKKYKVRGIGKDEKFVDIESGLSGLRYCVDKNQTFSEDDEYVDVKKIDDNWYVYTRDWN